MVTLVQLQAARDNDSGLQDYLLPIDVGLGSWPRIDLDTDQHAKFKHGNHFPFSVDNLETGKVRVYGPDGDLLGLADLSPKGKLQPARVFNL